LHVLVRETHFEDKQCLQHKCFDTNIRAVQNE